MRNWAVIILLSLTANSAFAQITFERGYFIRNDSTRTECLIKNLDWKNNPTEFQYRTDTEESQAMKILDVLEFGIYGQSTFKTITVDIDRSVFSVHEITTRNPEFKRETLALKVLVAGIANLYYFEDKEVVRFFFSVGDPVVKQLVFKEYLIDSKKIGRNELFKQQLWMDVNCGDLSQESFKKIQYETDELTAYFRKFNRCSGAEDNQQQDEPTRKVVNLKVVAGMGVSTLDVRNWLDYYAYNYNKKFSNEITYHIGFEAEMILPFNKNKWTLLIEPSYNTFHGTEGNDSWGNEAKYNTLEIALGARHYFFLKKQSKIFLTAAFIGCIPLNESLEYLSRDTQMTYAGALGVGFAHDRISAEFRFYPNHEILGNYNSWSGQYNKSIIIIGYRIF